MPSMNNHTHNHTHTHSHGSCHHHAISSDEKSLRQEYQQLMRQFWFAAIISIPVMIFSMPEMIPGLAQWMPEGSTHRRVIWSVMGIFALLVLIISGSRFYRGLWHGLKKGRANMYTLIATGISAAFLYSTVAVIAPQWFPQASLAKVFWDVVTVMTAFILLGMALEVKARGKTSAALKELIGLQPKRARVKRNGEIMDIPATEVREGDEVIIRPGETVPVDGVVIEGSSTIDESMITGESMPVTKQIGDNVIGGTLNKLGSLSFRATNVGRETVLAQMIRLVEQAQESRVPVQNLVDTISAYFVPGVIVLGLIAFALWLRIGPQPAINYATIIFVTTLIIACPCALGLATPTALTVGIGKAAEHGILIRHGAALQKIHSLDTLVLDKTGTLTQGKPKVTDVICTDKFARAKLLKYASALASRSEHPLSAAIHETAANEKIDMPNVERFHAQPGGGVIGRIDSRWVVLGNAEYLKTQDIDCSSLTAQATEFNRSGKTVVFVGIDKQFAGFIAVSDPIKPDTRAAIQTLKRMGLEIWLVTGDREATAQSIAEQVGIPKESVRAQAKPADKVKFIQELQAQNKKVGMVGDGINDAPALSQADVGFAMGTGTDVAMEAGDITLVRGSIQGVVAALRISEATLRNIKQNLFGAFIYNMVGIPIAMGVLYPVWGILLSPMIAAAAMALSSVTVVTNANRLRRFKF